MSKSNVITGYFQQGKLNRVVSIEPLSRQDWGQKCYEDALKARIACSNERIDRLHDSGDWHCADMELVYVDALKTALKLYTEWSLS